MSLQVPSSPSDHSSSASSEPPRTPLTPPPMSDLLPDVANLSTSLTTTAPAGKRKPSRRANTAERRATHNAVERQRRETLNGRFLDLAGLLPNLSQIRRPSKSAIVNSSIAHIHASRRHRLVAARELRLLKLEADALRRELNEWRDRSGLPRVEEPVRGDGFNLVLSGEVEVVVPNNMDDDDMIDEDDEDSINPAAAVAVRSSSDEVDDIAQAAAVALLKASGQAPQHTSSSPNNPFAHSVSAISNPQTSIVNPTHSRSQSSAGSQPHPAITQLFNGRQHPHSQPPMHHMLGGANGGPMIAGNPTGISYENPAMGSGYDGHSMLPNHSQYGFGPGNFGHNQLPPHILAQLAAEMENKANAAWYNNMGQFTPPASSNEGSPVGSPYGIGGGITNGTYPQQRRSVYGDDGRDSVVGRERSSSLGSRGSPVGNYDMVGGAPGNGGVSRWLGGDDGLADSFKVGPPGTGNAPGYAMMM